jgi:hypothetical protein
MAWCFSVYPSSMCCLTQVSKTLVKAWKTLGEGFAECNTRQRKLDELYIGNDFFAEYILSSTQQRLYRVSTGTQQRKSSSWRLVTSIDPFSIVHCTDTRQRVSLCRAYKVTLDKEFPSLLSIPCLLPPPTLMRTSLSMSLVLGS